MQPCYAESIPLLLVAFQTLAAGQTVETVPDSLQPLIGVWNQSVTLPCHISPPVSALTLHVRWYGVLFDRPVHLYRYRHNDWTAQDSAYQGRTSLFKEELEKGNVSLRLTKLRPSDSGVYRCFVDGGTWHDQREINLIIPVMGSQPTVSQDSTVQSRLLCRSEGWFPEPRVTWRDRRGREVMSYTTLDQNTQGLFRITSHIDVPRESDVFSCMVTAGEPHGESKLHIAEDPYPPVCGWKVLFFLTVTLSVIAVPLLFHAWRKLDKKCTYVTNLVTDHLEKELADMRQPIKSEWKFIRGCAATVTLDPDTAFPRLVLSDDGKQVHVGEEWLELPDDGRRFMRYPCILGREGFSTGRHYWEVEVGCKPWSVGVCRMSVDRTGDVHTTPDNGYWTMELSRQEEFKVGETSLSVSLKLAKVGIYLDYEEGQVSFYNAETCSHIHTLTDYFTETLYPFLYLGTVDGNVPFVICPREETGRLEPHHHPIDSSGPGGLQGLQLPFNCFSGT